MARKTTRRIKGTGSIRQRNGSWIVQVQVNGKPVQRSAKTESAAVMLLKRLQREVDDQIFSPAKLTLKTYLTGWLETKRGQISPKTLEGYTRTAKHLNRHLGNVQLVKLTSPQLQRAFGVIRDDAAAVESARCKAASKPVSPNAGITTANQCRTNLHTALEDAVTAVPPLLMRNPVKATKAFKNDAEEIVIWTPKQMSVFLETAREHALYPLFVLAIGTGLRRGELLGLRWKDLTHNALSVVQQVKVEDNKAVIGGLKTPSAKRRVPVGKNVLVVLDSHREKQTAQKQKLKNFYKDSGLVFASGLGRHYHPRNVERDFQTLQDRARERLPELPYATLHTLRHYYASASILAKVDPKTLSKRMGHSSVRLSLDRYSHIWDEVEAAAEGLDVSHLLTTALQPIHTRPKHVNGE